MKPLYFFCRTIFTYPIRLFFARHLVLNNPKKAHNQTIYVSNHPASFMDPLMLPILTKPVYYFLGRADVFTKFTRPIFKNAQILPIYRQQDGVNTKEKNKEVFKASTQILLKGKNILIFGEGFTDDVFIRRVKPIKKGAVRIAFSTLETCNWEKKISIKIIGINYTSPAVFSSDLLVSFSKSILVNDYKEQYEKNPVKTINELNAKIELELKNQITHLENPNDSLLHENIMRISGIGMNETYFKSTLSLEKRWRNSQTIANNLNKIDDQTKNKLKLRLEHYFKNFDLNNIPEKLAYNDEKKSLAIVKKTLLLIVFSPIFLLGMIHCYLPYLPLRYWIQKQFKRPVFWSSVKLLLNAVLVGIINIPVIYLMNIYIIENCWISIVYYLSLGLIGSISYLWMKRFKETIKFLKFNPKKNAHIVEERNEIINDLKKINLID